MMDEKTARLYTQMPEYRYLVRKTSKFIRQSLGKVTHPYVSCSFGKDSSVMLHLVFNQNPNVQVKFLGKKETSLIDDYDKVIQWWEKKGLVIERIIYKGWLEGGKSKGIAKNVTDDGFDAFFCGIRKEESVARRITLQKDGMFFKMKNGKTRIAPLADWKVRDIAAYMIANDLPILRAYKREGFSARTTSNIPSKYPHESIARLKDADIQAYNKLISVFPDAKYFT